MYNNIKPTATEPWRQLVEVLEFHEHETIQCQIESKDESLFIMQTIHNMRLGEYEGVLLQSLKKLSPCINYGYRLRNFK